VCVCVCVCVPAVTSPSSRAAVDFDGMTSFFAALTKGAKCLAQGRFASSSRAVAGDGEGEDRGRGGLSCIARAGKGSWGWRVTVMVLYTNGSIVGEQQFWFSRERWLQR
jgi:hypothetical protein